MAKKLLFINPFVEDFTAYNLWAVPLGLFRIMEFFESQGEEVVYLDLLDGPQVAEEGMTPPVSRSWGRRSYWKREIEKPRELSFVPRSYFRFGASDGRVCELLSAVGRPDKVYITTGMTYWYRCTQRVIDLVREVYGGVGIDIGGISATLIPGFFERDGVKVNSGRAQIPPEVTGTGCRSLPNLKFFPANLVEGCPNRCPYCSSAIFYPKVYLRSAGTLADNLEKWHAETGCVDVAFYDDALLLRNGRYLREFLDMLEPGKYRFHTPNGLHLHEVDDGLCEYFTRYDFPQLRFGFETAFARYEDKTSLTQLIRTADRLTEHGYPRERIGVYLLCGLPNQSVSEVERSIDVVAGLGLRPYLSEFSPVPGTSLYFEHIRESKLDFVSEPLYQNNTLSSYRSPVFTPDVMKKLRDRLNKIYETEGSYSS